MLQFPFVRHDMPHTRTVGLLTRFFSRLKFPWLFGLFLTLFGLDLLLPDLLPFMDELLLGLMTLLLGAWKDRKSAAAQASEAPPLASAAATQAPPTGAAR